MSPPAPDVRRPRLVLLGASNLARGRTVVIGRARHALGGPIDVLAAIGHGRSYGGPSRVLARTLPGILECDLWPALAATLDRPPTHALVTDIGNDILYGVDVATIAGWVATCVERLRASDADVLVTQLPLAGLRRLGALRFLAMRAVLFPRSRVTYRQVLDAIETLAAQLTTLTERRDARLLEVDETWYGLDPIHLRRRQQHDAWARLLASWSRDWTSDDAPLRMPRGERTAIRRARPALAWHWGIERRTSQPSSMLADGTSIEMY